MSKHIVLLFIGIWLLMIFFSNKSMSQKETVGVQEGVHHMAEDIVRDLHSDGPIAWLKYFSHSPQFFMASDGSLVFPNNDSAAAFVSEYAKKMRRIDLTWSDIRVDSLAPYLAVLAASFREVQLSADGSEQTPAGYFTGVAEYTPSGWKLRNAHWSLARPQH